MKALKLSREVIDAARHHLAISPKQMERCWEALLYAEAKEKGEQTAMKAYSAFKELIRRRLQVWIVALFPSITIAFELKKPKAKPPRRKEGKEKGGL